MPTRKELNKNILDNLADKFNSPYDDLFRCVLRPKARGEGLMINKERLKSIKSAIYKKNNEIDEVCSRLSLDAVGGDDYDYFFQYQRDNPKEISKEELKSQSDEYYGGKDECIGELRFLLEPELKEDIMCLAIGEKIKSIHSRSLYALGLMWGEHTNFLSREEINEAYDIGKVFNEVWLTGKYSSKIEDTSLYKSGFLETTYGLTPEKKAKSGRSENTIAEKILK